MEKAKQQAILHAEVFFDPQAHTRRGVPFADVIEGIDEALRDAERRLGLTSKLILCFLRDVDTESAMATLDQALAYKDRIVAIGLDSAEVGNPPGKFAEAFARARREGFLTVAHAGEEGPAAYVREALDALHVSRIDHGNHALDDAALVQRLRKARIPLTLCPLSNLRLRVVNDLSDHPLRRMLEEGLFVTVNSDDPAYFGGYVNENYTAVQKALGLTREELVTLARNSFEASFLNPERKAPLIGRLEAYAAAH
jgi:adenosine deaminase